MQRKLYENFDEILKIEHHVDMNAHLIANILEVYTAIKGNNSSVPELEIALLESMTIEGLQLVYNDACTLAE